MIELLRERFVALLQEEADVSNQLTRIENELEIAVSFLKNKQINYKN